MSTLYNGPVCDPHMHFYDFNARPSRICEPKLRPAIDAVAGGAEWLPAKYMTDAKLAGMNVTSICHAEFISYDDPVGETKWLDGLQPVVPMKIICHCDMLSHPEQLAEQLAVSSNVVAVRQCVEPLLSQHCEDPNFLENPDWQNNYKKLADHGLAFDLLANPDQLEKAADFLATVPSVPVCVEHLGYLVLNRDEEENCKRCEEWEAGMAKLAKLPHVYAKLSFPARMTKPLLEPLKGGFQHDAEKTAIVRDVIKKVVNMFGAERCMFASNYPIDKLYGTDLKVLYKLWQECAAGYSEAEQRALFHDTAVKFYKITE